MFRFSFLVSFSLLITGIDLSAAVLELGSSEVQGKKDQPDAVTFVARAPLPIGSPEISFKGKARIIEEAKRGEIFKLEYSN